MTTDRTVLDLGDIMPHGEGTALDRENNPFVDFVRIVVGDFLRVAVVWVLLYLFDLLTMHMPVPGFAGRLIHAIHQAGSVALVLILVIWLLIDVIQSLRKKKSRQ
jgi:hypothetical protein